MRERRQYDGTTSNLRQILPSQYQYPTIGGLKIMNRYFINDVKCGVVGGGFVCGSVPGTVTGSIQFKKDDRSLMWLTLSDVMGIANFYLTGDDIYDKVQDIDDDDEDFIDKLNDEYFIRSFDGISFGEYGEYRDVFRSIEENKDNPTANFILYLVALVRCGWDELPGLVEAGKSKYADEIDLSGVDMK